MRERIPEVLAVDGRRENRDARQGAVVFGVVEAITDNELVGNVETNQGNLDINLGSGRLAKQRDNLDRRGTAGLEVRNQPAQGQARVDDVFDDQDVATKNVGVEVFEDPHDARRNGARAV